MRVWRGERSSGSRFGTEAGQIPVGVSEQILVENTRLRYVRWLGIWNSGAADGDQHTPLGCVTFATIDLQFGLFSFRSKWFFHLRPEACKLNLSSALWAKVIILLPQNSLEAHTCSSVSFALFPSCARKSRVLVLKISSRVTRCSGSLWFFWLDGQKELSKKTSGIALLWMKETEALSLCPFRNHYSS